MPNESESNTLRRLLESDLVTLPRAPHCSRDAAQNQNSFFSKTDGRMYRTRLQPSTRTRGWQKRDNEALEQTQFRYDPKQPFEQKRQRAKQRDGVSVANIQFASTTDESMKAYWVTPNGDSPFPALIFLHPAPGNRDTFLDEAIMLAQQGAASLLIQAPWADFESWIPKVSHLEGNRALFTEIAIELRRAIDWVLAQPNIDATRIGFVGHSFGALMAGILAGIEKRIKAFVLMAGSGSFTDVAVANMPDLQGEPFERYAASMAPIDPIHFVSHAAPAALLYQIARNDQIFPLEQTQAFADAGSEPKLVKYYDADHYLDAAARKDRSAWLQEQLNLKSSQSNQNKTVKKGKTKMARNQGKQNVNTGA